MSAQQPDHPSSSGSQNKNQIEAQTQHEPQNESEAFKTSHFYDDGNITFNVRGTMFKVHKSILALYSEVFKDMFSLPGVQPIEGVPLDDDPGAFDTTLNAIYKGIDFLDQANIMQLMDVIAIAHKYQMSHLEDFLQDRITKSMLPSSATDGLDCSKFRLYDEHPGLAMAVLRVGSDKLAPWALYNVGVQFFSTIIAGDTSTYESPPTWFAFNPKLTYALLILRQIITDTFTNWYERIQKFYQTRCLSLAKSAAECARPFSNFVPGDLLYIPPEKRVDPVREMVPKLQELNKVFEEQQDLISMSAQQPTGSSSSGSETNNQPEAQTKFQSQTESEVFKTSHFYKDGNITFNVTQPKPKKPGSAGEHKDALPIFEEPPEHGEIINRLTSILALYSELFRVMFNLPGVQSVEGQGKPVPLDDDPRAFDTTLNAIYKGLDFLDQANIMQLMDVIAIAHKYQMSRVEGYLHGRITKSMLPSTATDGLDCSKFHLYDDHPGLAMAVLRVGSDELAPWAFYNVGVQFFSKITTGDMSTYEPLPTWFTFDPEFAYAFLILRRIITDTFANCETVSMPAQQLDGPSEGQSSGSESRNQIQAQTQPQSQTESETFKTSHFYDDGNITFNVRGTMFKVHKSILALYSEVFKDMFGLPNIQPVEGQDNPIPLDDDPRAFDNALSAIYTSIDFLDHANIMQFMDAIAIAHKYQMSRLEDFLQGRITKSMLPSCVTDGLNYSKFHLYDEYPGLAMAVLRIGSDELAPWALYNVGVQLFSKITTGDTSTYEPLPTWFAFDLELAHAFLILRQIIADTFVNWYERLNDFYETTCPLSVLEDAECARPTASFIPSDFLYIPGEKRVDPVREMVPKLQELNKVLEEQQDAYHSGWCSKCNATLKEVASSSLIDTYPNLVGCITRMNRMKPRFS